jgi:hypothetical protein
VFCAWLGIGMIDDLFFGGAILVVMGVVLVAGGAWMIVR